MTDDNIKAMEDRAARDEWYAPLQESQKDVLALISEVRRLRDVQGLYLRVLQSNEALTSEVLRLRTLLAEHACLHCGDPNCNEQRTP